MNTKISKLKENVLESIGKGLIIFLIGFFQMFILWSIYYKNSAGEVKGFFDFKTATWGDGIFLPILISSSSFIISSSSKLKKIDNKYYFRFGIIIAIVAIFIQTSWIANITTPLNWTIPELRHFNLAGWYHAFFFIFASFFLSINIVKIFVLLRKNSDLFNKPEEVIALFLFFYSILTFIYLFISDDYFNPIDNFRYFSLICCINFLCLVVAVIILIDKIDKKILINIFSCLMLAYFSSYGTVIFIYNQDKFSSNLMILLITLLFSTILVAKQVNRNIEMLKNFIIIIIPTVFLSYVNLCYHNFFIWFISWSIPSTIAYVVQKDEKIYINDIVYDENDNNKNSDSDKVLKKTQKLRSFITMGIIALLLINTITHINRVGSLIDIDTSYNGDVISNIVSIIIGFITYYCLNNMFEFVKSAERDNADSNKCKSTKKLFYVNMVIIFIGNLLFLLNVFEIKITLDIMLIILFFLPSFILFFLLIILFKRIKISQKMISNENIIYSISIAIISFIYLSIIMFLIKDIYIYWDFYRNLIKDIDINTIRENLNIIIFIIVLITYLFVNIGCAIFIAKGFYDNLVLINGLRKKNIELISSILIFVFLFIINILILLPIPNKTYFSLEKFALIIFIISVSNICLPFILSKCICNEEEIKLEKVTESLQNPTASVLQDGFFCSVLYMISGYFSLGIFSKLLDINNASDAVIKFISIILVVYIYIPLCTKNNIWHFNMRYSKYYDKKDKNIDYRKVNLEIEELRKHLNMQTIVCFIATPIYSILYFSIYFLELMIKKGTAIPIIKKELLISKPEYISNSRNENNE